MSKYSIGIDTGGTYTDAVIVNARSHRVLASAKALTTKGDLAIGVGNALESVLAQAGDGFDRKAVSLISLSTTLATNALVEKHGSSVTTFLIGFDDGMAERTQITEAVSEARIVRIDGGHRYTGTEQTSLDTDALVAALEGEAGTAEAFAVASLYSVRNASHEKQAEEIIRAHRHRPVSLSCDLSDALDGPRRALTATFNARIISLIVALETAVRTSMQRLGIDARIMMVKGDGSIAPSTAVTAKPIETILSGPAASVIGARFLSGQSDFVISDIGGTTSDVATVRKGWPKLNEHGSDVGGFRTLVRAIDMQTVGLGGDSEVEIDFKGNVSLRNNRVVPISMVADKWPHVAQELEIALGENSGMLSATRYVMFPDGSAGYKGEIDQKIDLKPADLEFLNRLDSQKPKLYRDLVYSAADRSRLPRLIDRGLLQISGFTPSDAAHVLGLQSQWSTEGARFACELLGRATGKVTGANRDREMMQFSQEIHDAVAAKSTRLILERLANRSFTENDPLIEAVASNRHQLGDLRVNLCPDISVIAVGGPASVFYPAVGDRLGTTVIIPTGSEVANAIGAAIGMIKVRVAVEVTRRDKGGFSIHGDGEPLLLDDGPAALEKAREMVHNLAKARSSEQGGHEAEIDVQIKRIDIPDLPEDISLISAMVTAEVVSKAEGN